jgi:hypothetical protein
VCEREREVERARVIVRERETVVRHSLPAARLGGAPLLLKLLLGAEAGVGVALYIYIYI